MTHLSVDDDGNPANHLSGVDAITPDARYVVFGSLATNLAPNDGNDTTGVFVRDVLAGTTTQASVSSTGEAANDYSSNGDISSDGRYVVFESQATNLVTDEPVFSQHIYMHDRTTGITTRVSVNSAGVAGVGVAARSPSICGDGRYVAFSHDAANYVADDANGFDDIFVRDVVAGTTTLISRSSTGTPGNWFSGSPVISQNGRYVAFNSLASNLVPGDGDLIQDVFLRDLHTGTTTKISQTSTGVRPDGDSQVSSITADGRLVAFSSIATNMTVGDTNGQRDVFIRDTVTNTTYRVSEDAYGGQSNGWSSEASLSGDGRYVAFGTSANNLFPNDWNGLNDVVMRAARPVNITSVTPEHLPRGASTSITVQGTGFMAGATPHLPGASLSNVLLVDEGTMTFDAHLPGTAAAGTKDLVILVPGSGAGLFTGSTGLCSNCVTYQ